MVRCLAAALAAIVVGACHGTASRPPAPETGKSRYLFVWAGDGERKESDFLAVIDVDRNSPRYASIVATVPTGVAGSRPHHTEYDMPASGILWANGFDAGLTFRFDLRDPMHPRLLQPPGNTRPFEHPHSYARLPNGDVLATFQWRRGASGTETGGLVEFDSSGRVVRSSAASAPEVDSGVRPYSLAVVPALDRVVSTATDMHLQFQSRAVQVWRLSDLTLLQTLLLPPGPRGDENWLTAEPRVLADGRTVLVNTFSCGLFRLRGLDGDSATAEWVYSSAREAQGFCAVPVVAGHFWLQPSGPEHAVVSLDLTDPSRPREVGRLTLQPREIPHWLALEPNGDRVVITGYQELESRILLARVDRVTGSLQLDSSFTSPGAERPGVALLQGDSGRHAIPHGAVFSHP